MGNTQQVSTSKQNLFECQIAKTKPIQSIKKVFKAQKANQDILIAIGNYSIENYDANTQKLLSSYVSVSKITDCIQKAFIHQNQIIEFIIIINQQDLEYNLDQDIKIIYKDQKINKDEIINKQNSSENIKTQAIKVMKTNIKYNEEQIKTLNPQQKMNFNSFFLGYSNGFVQKMAINFSSFNLEEIGNEFEGQVVCTMNPIQVEALKTREIMYDNLHLPGIVSLNYCQKQKYLIVSHRKQDVNENNQMFILEQSPINIYNEQDGKLVKSIKGVLNNILECQILQNRGLLIVLDSENSLNIISYINGEILHSIRFNPFIKQEQINRPFKLLEIFEYPLEFQTHLVEKFYPQFENKNLQQKKIDGDIIFLLTDEGDIMISKLKYAEINKENKLCFSPEKIFNLKRDNQAVPKKIAQSIIYESDYASVSLSDASFIIYNDIITQYYQSILD